MFTALAADHHHRARRRPRPISRRPDYVDQTLGSDSAAGTTQTAPWKTLGKVAATPLHPGDSVLLRRGRTWTGGLAVNGSGSSSSPVKIGAYGDGARPIVQGNDGSRASTCRATTSGSQDLQVGVAADAGRCSWAGVEVGGDHDKVLSNYITGAGAGVYIAPTADGTEVTQNDLVDNNHMTRRDPGRQRRLGRVRDPRCRATDPTSAGTGSAARSR